MPGSIVLYCYCGKQILEQDIHKTYLRDEGTQRKRYVAEATCECRPEFYQFNANLYYEENGKERYIKPKLKDVDAQYIKWMREPHIKLTNLNVKHGTFQNMNWHSQRNGKVYNDNNQKCIFFNNILYVEEAFFKKRELDLL